MARKGSRMGAGRKEKIIPLGYMIEGGLKPGQQSPLEYMLDVINDPTADAARRDALAIAAARYCHPRQYDRRVGKKENQAEAAKMAGAGSEWGKDLQFEGTAN